MQNELSKDSEILLLTIDNGFSLLTSSNCFDFVPLNTTNFLQVKNHNKFRDSLRLYLSQQEMIYKENLILKDL